MRTAASAGEPMSSSRREHLVARRLDPARARAEDRVQRFVDAAIALMNASDSAVEFTVQEVADSSGQSLRSFYQCFGGKDELMLAVFEESVLLTIEHLRALVEQEDTALERLHRFVIEYYRMCQPSRQRHNAEIRPTPSLSHFAQHLLAAEPRHAARAFAPLVGLFEQVLADAVEDGAVRPDLASQRVAGTVLEAVMFNAFSSTIAGVADVQDGDPAEDLYDLVLHGIGSGPA